MQNSHKLIQLTLKQSLVPQEVWLEKSFPTIHRIADVVWPAQKIIFEVQCSPISIKEIRQRNQDYSQVGYTVVWILHDRRFNQRHLTPAEHYLRTQPHYFTNINSFGHGEIYDQYAPVLWGRRLRRTPRYPLSISDLTPLKHVSRQFPKERRQWQLSFGGDLFHQKFKVRPTHSIFRLYRVLFRFILEKNLD